nr:hypothetical protein [Halomonas sp.]
MTAFVMASLDDSPFPAGVYDSACASPAQIDRVPLPYSGRHA